MKILKITKYNDLNDVNNYLGQDFIVDLEECRMAIRTRVIDFLSGLVYLNGKLEKKNKDQFIVKGI